MKRISLQSLSRTALMMILLLSLMPLIRSGSSFTQTEIISNNLSQNDKYIQTLELGKPIERDISGAQAHYYHLTLSAGQYLRLAVDQQGIDVTTAFFGPDGKKLIEVNNPNGSRGQEVISWIAEVSGIYKIEVRSLEKETAAGRYEARIQELRVATTRDRNHVAAEQAYMQGELLLAQGTAESLGKALEKYKEAASQWKVADDCNKEAEALISVGFTYSRLGENNKALDYLEQSLPLFRSVANRRGEAETLGNIGYTYDELGEKRKALDYLNLALAIFKVLGDTEGTAVTLNNIGRVYDSIGEEKEALDYFGQSLSLRQVLGDRKGEAVVLNNMAAVYDNLGEKQKALDNYVQSLSLRRALKDRRGEAVTLNNLGLIYAYLGEESKALDYYNESLPLRRTIGDRRGEAVTLQNIGWLYNSIGRKQEALDYLNQSLCMFESLGDRRGQAYALNNIGSVHDSLGDSRTALDYFEKSLPLRRAVGDRQGEAVTLQNIGWVYNSMEKREEAHETFIQALTLFRKVGNRSKEVSALFGLAVLERDRGNFIKARAHVESAIDVIELLRTKIAIQELRASYFASAQRHHEFYISLLMRLHKVYPSEGFDALALRASERARARSLIELLTEARMDIRQGVEPSLLERERYLLNLLQAKSNRQVQLLSSRHAEAHAELLEKEIKSITTEYRQVQARIRTASPRYAAITQPQPLSLKEIQQEVLDPDTLMLEYAMGEDRSFLWAVTPTAIAGFELPKRAEIEGVARHFYELLTARNRREKGETPEQRRARLARAEEEYPAVSATLSRMLLGPVASHLGRKRLLIIADGALHYVPFAALPDPATIGKDETAGHPLVVSHELVSLPSASTLAVLRRELAGRKPAPKMLAVLADPVFQKDDPRVRRRVEEGKGKISPDRESNLIPADSVFVKSAGEVGMIDSEIEIPRLPFTRQEATAIMLLASRKDSFQALDFNANRATAISAEFGQYRIIHFATHGLLNSSHPELSGIVLSLVDWKGAPQDGFITLNEIYNLKLPAELVVLSACQTALGKEIKGEGLVGLTRGFMYAGAARTMASLWKVDDEATAELMKRFYIQMLKNKRRPSEALRAAQVSMLENKDWQSPYYWGAFVFQGEWR